jgi:hypothetical protein
MTLAVQSVRTELIGGHVAQRVYRFTTSAGLLTMAPAQTAILAPEDPAGIKRAHAEALVINVDEDFLATLILDQDVQTWDGRPDRDLYLRTLDQMARDGYAEATEALDPLHKAAEMVREGLAKPTLEHTTPPGVSATDGDLVARDRAAREARASVEDVEGLKEPVLAARDHEVRAAVQQVARGYLDSGYRLALTSTEMAEQGESVPPWPLSPSWATQGLSEALADKPRCKVGDVVRIHQGTRLYEVLEIAEVEFLAPAEDMARVVPCDPTDERDAQWVNLDLLHVMRQETRVSGLFDPERPQLMPRDVLGSEAENRP